MMNFSFTASSTARRKDNCEKQKKKQITEKNIVE